MTAPSDLASAAQGLAAALLAACVDPADGVRLLGQLASFQPPASQTGSDAIGAAMADMQDACADLFRRAGVVVLARASTLYEPASYDDAAALRDLLADALDAEATIAADQGEDATYAALRTLRQAVIQDLTTRGGSLAPIRTFSFNASLPAMVLANRIYRDPSRGDELVTHADPVHPLFMPLQFKALAE